jgi:hypothetical protein
MQRHLGQTRRKRKERSACGGGLGGEKVLSPGRGLRATLLAAIPEDNYNGTL